MAKLTLPTLAAAINDLAAELERIRADMPQVPDDLVRVSDIPDIPAPPDLSPLSDRIESLARTVEDLASVMPDESSIQSVADARAGARVGPVKGRLTQLWNDLSAEKARIDAIEASLPGVRDAVQSVVSRECPYVPERVDIAPIRADVESLAARLDSMGQSISAISETISNDTIHGQIDGIIATQKTIREDITETRMWLADMGKAWQRHRAETRDIITESQNKTMEPTPTNDPAIDDLRSGIARLQSELSYMADRIPNTEGLAMMSDIPDVSELRAEVDGVRTAIHALSARQCPVVDLSGIEKRLMALERKECPNPDL